MRRPFLAAATLVAALAPAAPAAAANRLWYRVSVTATVHRTYADPADGRTTTTDGEWTARTSGAILVTRVCVDRRSGGAFGEGACAAVFRHRHRPATAVDDIQLSGGANGALVRSDERRVQDEWHLVDPMSGDALTCAGFTQTSLLDKMAHVRGTLSTASARVDGLAFRYVSTDLPGSLVEDTPEHTCLRDSDGSVASTSPAAHAVYDVELPWITALGEPTWPIRFGPTSFGRSFTVTRTGSRIQGSGGITDTSRLRTVVRLALCPRGGRDVRHC